MSFKTPARQDYTLEARLVESAVSEVDWGDSASWFVPQILLRPVLSRPCLSRPLVRLVSAVAFGDTLTKS